MSKYFEVKGETLKKIQQVYDDQKIPIAEARKLVKEVGAEQFQYTTRFGMTMIGVVFANGKEPAEFDKRLRKYWNRSTCRHENWYVPNRSSKAGKEFDTRMRKIRIPGRDDVASILKLKHYDMPGIRMYGKGKRQRIVVAVPDHYKPRGKLGKDLTRISDIEAEKLEARKAKKKRRK